MVTEALVSHEALVCVVSHQHLPSTLLQPFFIGGAFKINYRRFCSTLTAATLTNASGSSASGQTQEQRRRRPLSDECPLTGRPVPLRSQSAACCVLALLLRLAPCQDSQSSGALKMPMMPRLRTRLTTSAPIVPRKDGIAPWATSHALREVMSAITPCIWKCVPTTALMWKSWWL